MRVTVLLDTSALTAWANPYSLGAVEVGELMMVVAEDPDACLGIPAGALLDAYGRSGETGRARLRRLVEHPDSPCVCLPMTGAEVPAIQIASEAHPGTTTVPRLHVHPHTVVLARGLDVDVATFAAAAASTLLDPDQVYALGGPGEEEPEDKPDDT